MIILSGIIRNDCMRFTIAGIVLLFCSIQICFAQTIVITGKVVDKSDGIPIERALVTVKRTDNNSIVAFSQTSKEGAFEIKKVFNLDECKVEVSCMGYASQEKAPDNNRPMLFEMDEKEIKLREVTITASKIGQKGDTIRYRVSAFSAESDRTIGDVLKKMPGIEVAESGEIKYQGQAINKFYVENSDLLGGRYGLAVNNISHKDVAGVEVMENHQPVRALEDIIVSTQPAINIKLKEDAKSRWAGTIKVGGGIPSLWNTELFAMRFKKKVQSMNTYKGNNVGNIYNDAILFIPPIDFINTRSRDIPTYIDVQPSMAKGIGSNRNRFEKKHNLTSNNLVKVGNSYDLLPEIIASHNRRDSEYNSSTTYFLDGEELAVEEKNEVTNAIEKSIEGKIQLKGNKERFYLNNTTNFIINWNEADMDILGTYPNRQAATITNRTFNNNFSILKRIGNKVISIQSFNGYTEKPQSLIVTKNGKESMRQDVDVSNFHSETSAKYGFILSKFYLDMEGKLLYLNRKMSNTLNTVKDNSQTEKIMTEVKTSIQFKTESFNTTLNIPLFYQHFSAAGVSKNIPGVNPALDIKWDASGKMTFNLHGAYQMELPDERLFYNGNILNNYRMMSAGYINFDTGNSYYTSAGIRYKDVLNLFFADASISLSKSMRNKIFNQSFINDYILNEYIPAHIEDESITIGGSISKSMEGIDGFIMLSPMWSAGRKELMRNEVKLPYNNQLYGLRGQLNLKVIKWCNMDYISSYMYNSFTTEQHGSSSYDRFSQSLAVNFLLLKSLQLKYTLEHYRNELEDGIYKNFVFSDITMSYLLGSRWELSCFVKNIFNEKRYSYFTENELIANKQDFKIRGRDILINVSYRF